MAEYGEVILDDAAGLVPEVAAIVSRRVDFVHGIYTAGDEDLVGIEVVAGGANLIIACWGDELSIGTALPEGLHGETPSDQAT
jgi:hypothetical protein